MKTIPSQVLVGADPELFFVKEELIYPLDGKVGGSKNDPIPVKFGGLQEDNVMAEFNIDPASSADEFVRNICSVMGELETRASALGADISDEASKFLTQYQLETALNAKQFGCSPDYNVYTLSRNPTPDTNSLLRTCGGHVHLGFNRKVKEKGFLSDVVKSLDFYLGLWCVVNDPDTLRMERYGKAGAMRPKPYGVEYRVPSNFWIHNTDYQREVYARCIRSYEAVYNGEGIPLGVEHVINSQDKDTAQMMLEEAGWLQLK